jgi:hypothetical protein
MTPGLHPHPALSSQSGIAIGPILFVIAMLAVLAVAMQSGGGGFGQASVTDRISADISTQANLIRAKITECNTVHGTDSNYDGYPSSLSGGTVTPTLVKNLNCNGDTAGQQNLWTGARNTSYPPPTTGFSDWYYVNTNSAGLGGTATGGRCIYIKPTSSGQQTNSGLVAGLTKAVSKFTHSTTNDGASEINYDPASSSQKVVLWITVPAQGSEDSNCVP